MLKWCAQQILEKEIDPNLRLFVFQLWKMIHMFSFLLNFKENGFLVLVTTGGGGTVNKKRKPSLKQFSCYSFKSFPLTQNCYFGAPGHRTKSWVFESIWTHGGREGEERWQNGDAGKDEGNQISCFTLCKRKDQLWIQLYTSETSISRTYS